jgi:lipoprotein NlpI
MLIARYNRALALTEMGRHADALAAFDHALALDPGHFESRRWRAYVLLYLGRPAEAAEALSAVLAERPADNYLALWAHVARRLAGRDGDGALLSQDLKATQPEGWPSPANAMFQGKLAPEALIALAKNADAETDSLQRCEALAFAGAFSLINGKRGEAAEHFRRAAEIRRPHLIAYIFANAELKRLGGN